MRMDQLNSSAGYTPRSRAIQKFLEEFKDWPDEEMVYAYLVLKDPGYAEVVIAMQHQSSAKKC
jgi:hypothetical protein